MLGNVTHVAARSPALEQRMQQKPGRSKSLGLPLRPWGYRLSDELFGWERGE
jgi:hypothetical protein